MKCEWIYGLVGLGLAASSALGAAPSFPIVKIESGLCGGSGGVYRGSGMIFSHQGRAFVLTSEHILLHAEGRDGRICHSVYSAQIQKKRAVLKTLEWGTGLALLELENQVVSADWPTLRSFQSDLPRQGTQIEVTGYPYASDQLVQDTAGQVLIPESDRHLMPMLKTMIEITGAHGEFGMSGAPVLTPSSTGSETKVLGVLSHQILKLVAGGKTVVDAYQRDVQVLEGHLLVIPSSVVLEWLSAYFSSRETLVPYFVRDLDAQLQNRSVVIAGGLRFESSIHPERAKLPNPVGGGDGFGIGGGDGFGIGGNSRSGLEPVMITVSENTNTSVLATNWYLTERRPWLDQMKNRLLLRQRIEIPFLIQKNSSTLELNKLAVGSLEDFFGALTFRNVNPVTVYSGGSGGVTNLKAAVEEIRSSAVVSQRLVEALAQQGKDHYTLENRLFLNRLQVMIEVLQSDDWALIGSQDVRALSDTEKFHTDWKALFSASFDHAVELLRRLNETADRLSKLKG